MKRYWMYLRYVVRHRWFVMLACFRRGLLWRGLVHDWHKFLPSEFIPYARFFYNRDGTKRQIRDKTGYYKPYDTGDAAFDRAWVRHFQRTDHHPQSWCSPQEDGTVKVLDMSRRAVREMVCDWQGAGRAQGVENWCDVRPWYHANKDKLQLYQATRVRVELLIDYWPEAEVGRSAGAPQGLV